MDLRLRCSPSYSGVHSYARSWDLSCLWVFFQCRLGCNRRSGRSDSELAEERRNVRELRCNRGTGPHIRRHAWNALGYVWSPQLSVSLCWQHWHSFSRSSCISCQKACSRVVRIQAEPKCINQNQQEIVNFSTRGIRMEPLFLSLKTAGFS